MFQRNTMPPFSRSTSKQNKKQPETEVTILFSLGFKGKATRLVQKLKFFCKKMPGSSNCTFSKYNFYT
jgi:hypothetical protein